MSVNMDLLAQIADPAKNIVMDFWPRLKSTHNKGRVSDIIPTQLVSARPSMLGRDGEEDSFVSEQQSVTDLRIRFASGDQEVQSAVAQLRQELTATGLHNVDINVLVCIQKIPKHPAQRATRQRGNDAYSKAAILRGSGSAGCRRSLI